jgi:dihydroorotate dehydrogenase (NAD+) catalytic subunit
MAGVRAATSKPVIAKLSPNVTDIGEIARGAEAGGAHALTAVNTLLGMAVDWRSRKPGLATLQGGYSGTGIKPVALRCAWTCARAVSIPVIGCGGVASAEDVLEFLVVGCSAVQVGTAAFGDPSLIGRLGARLSELLDRAGVADVRELIGSLRDGRASARATGVAT